MSWDIRAATNLHAIGVNWMIHVSPSPYFRQRSLDTHCLVCSVLLIPVLSCSLLFCSVLFLKESNCYLKGRFVYAEHYHGPGHFVLQDCGETAEYFCHADNTAYGLVSIMVFFALLYFALYCYFISRAFIQLKTRSATEFRIANMIVRLQVDITLLSSHFNATVCCLDDLKWSQLVALHYFYKQLVFK